MRNTMWIKGVLTILISGVIFGSLVYFGAEHPAYAELARQTSSQNR